MLNFPLDTYLKAFITTIVSAIQQDQLNSITLVCLDAYAINLISSAPLPLLDLFDKLRYVIG